MNNFLTQAILIWLINGFGIYVLSKLPIGISVDGVGTALVWSLVLGVLNAFLLPILQFLSIPVNFATFGLFTFVLNAIIFALAAILVKGIRLRGGCLSALVGSLLLGLLNSFVLGLLQRV
jgi:putative membrane protein